MAKAKQTTQSVRTNLKSKGRNRRPPARKSASQRTIAPQTALSDAKTSLLNTENGSGRVNSKQARVIAMLNAPTGATMEAMMSATGWQAHTVRGFLAGVIRKKLGLDLGSESGKNGRVYRIRESGDPIASPARASKVA